MTPSRKRNAGFLPAVIAGMGEMGAAAGSGVALARLSFPAMKAEQDGFDLRHYWRNSAAPAGQPAGEGEDGGTGAGSAASTSSGDSSSPPPADGEEDEPDPEVIGNPKMKKLSDEAARYRTSAKAEKDRADAAEAKLKGLEGQANAEMLTTQLQDAKMENAFILAATGKVGDVAAAWKLADKAGVTITDEGVVEGLEEMLAQVLTKHPYLAPKPTDPAAEALADKFPALTASGRPNNGRKGDSSSVDYAALEKRFPALRGRR